MFRALYRQVVRFLDWVNRSGSGSSASRATREAADYRRDMESRTGSDSGGWGLKGAGGLRREWAQPAGARDLPESREHGEAGVHSGSRHGSPKPVFGMPAAGN